MKELRMADDTLPLLPHEERLAPRTDLWIAATFLTIGVAIVGLCLRMPTYLDQGGQLYTAPALVPGLYGLVIAALSVWLGFRALGTGALANAPAAAAEPTGNSAGRLALAAVLGLFFVVGLIGRMPFWLAAAIFVALFVAAFEWRSGLPAATRARRVGVAVVEGLVTGALVTLVFEKLFLVRLP